MKSIKIIGALVDRTVPFKASPWKVCLVILLVGTILLGQGSDSRFQAEASSMPNFTTMKNYTEYGRWIVFGSRSSVAGHVTTGRGQCSLCHTFDPGDNIGRCPNLFGVEERSHTRIKEDRYRNEPIKIGETDKASWIVKGKPDQIPWPYWRGGSNELTGEDYLRESMMCPSCYVVKGYGKAGDTKSPEPIIHKPPISLNWVELNAVIAWLQSKDTPGDYSRVTVPLPTNEEMAVRDLAYKIRKEKEKNEQALAANVSSMSVPIMINTLGCPLCHVIPGVEGSNGELGPKLHMKIDAPKRIKDPKYKGKAKTAREYVKESILNPEAYIVFNEEAGELYPTGVMPQDYGTKLSVRALESLVDFIANTQPRKNR